MHPLNQLMLAFKIITTEQIVKIYSLVQYHQYPVVAPRTITTQYGLTIQFTLRSEADINLHIYFSKRYADVVDDDDINHINLGKKI
jgi:hypothetical protein